MSRKTIFAYNIKLFIERAFIFTVLNYWEDYIFPASGQSRQAILCTKTKI